MTNPKLSHKTKITAELFLRYISWLTARFILLGLLGSLWGFSLVSSKTNGSNIRERSNCQFSQGSYTSYPHRNTPFLIPTASNYIPTLQINRQFFHPDNSRGSPKRIYPTLDGNKKGFKLRLTQKGPFDSMRSIHLGSYGGNGWITICESKDNFNFHYNFIPLSNHQVPSVFPITVGRHRCVVPIDFALVSNIWGIIVHHVVNNNPDDSYIIFDVISKDKNDLFCGDNFLRILENFSLFCFRHPLRAMPLTLMKDGSPNKIELFMKLFECSNCLNPVFFENTYCEKCGETLGYVPTENRMIALRFIDSDQWEIIQHGNLGVKQYYQFCHNRQYQACNWLLSPDQAGNNESIFCVACQLNNTIPNLNEEQNLTAWRTIEYAKHRLFYSLLRLGLPIISKSTDEDRGLEFEFLSDKNLDEDDEPIMTGHAQGVITLNIKEANPVYRESAKHMLKERYRTLIGHFRHEIGHYYWDLLIEPQPEAFRVLFGDERIDYKEALERYYQHGPTAHWQTEYISKYASMHPWEDWAECWAHYLHITDTLETAFYFGVSLLPKVQQHGPISLSYAVNPYEQSDFNVILDQSMAVMFAVNTLNRSMGQPDLYPFVMSNKVEEKIRFIHQVIRSC